jgi:glycosyltransferase involved in cell wall biosynthesis
LFKPEDPSSFQLLHDAIARWQQPMSEPQWLVLQYNPFGFGRRGWCPWVPSTLRKIRRHQPHLRVATMFHETMVPAWPWKFAVMHLWQSRIFRQICHLSDVSFVSTTRWQPQVFRAHPGLPCHHLPVGSNIPLDETPHAVARQRLGLPDKSLVLGVFGSAHISRQLDWIAAAAHEIGKMGRQVIVAHVGPDAAKICQALPNLQVRSFGELPAHQVGMHLRAMDVLVAPFSDGVSTRRGSVMAGLQHGVPVITTAAPWTDRMLIDADNEGLIALSCEGAASFAAMTAERLLGLLSATDISQRASQFYHRHFAWSTIAETLTGHLLS